MTLPGNVSTGTITGQFTKMDGTPETGNVTFTPAVSRLLDSAGNVVLTCGPTTVILNNTGSFSVALPATDDVDLNPVNWTYTVAVATSGSGYQFSMANPGGGSIDLADVSPVATSTGAPIGQSGSVFTPASPAPLQFITSGTVIGSTGASSVGYRLATFGIVAKGSAEIDNAVFMIDQVLLPALHLTDGVVTGTTTLTSASGLFTPAMSGYRVTATGSIPAGITATYVNATTMTLSAACINGTGLMVDLMPTVVRTTGIHVKSFTTPDNGGDTSAIFGQQTGGGVAVTGYKVCGRRPPGTPDYALSTQGATEFATDGGSFAVFGIAGVLGFGASGVYASQAGYFRVDNAVSEGVLVSPGDGVFDSRVAFVIGSKINNAASVATKLVITMAGTVTASGVITGSSIKSLGAGQATSSAINTTSNLGGSVIAADTGSASTNGGAIMFGSSVGLWGAIKGSLVNGTSNTTGDIVFATRNAVGDANLTTRLTLKAGGDFLTNGSGITLAATGHIGTGNAFAATTTIANGAGIGTTPGTPTIFGNDTCGFVVFTTGTGPTADGVMVTITLAYSATPKMVKVAPASATTAVTGVTPWIGSGDLAAGTFIVRLKNPAASTQYVVWYEVLY